MGSGDRASRLRPQRRLLGMDMSNPNSATAQSRQSRRIFILGATGGIGRSLIGQALERGHEVTAVVRSPDKLGALRERVQVVQGDPRNADQLRAALPGHDAVFSALGPPGPGRTTIHRDCARSTIAAMQETGVRRLLIISAAVLFEDHRLLFWLVRKTFLRNVAEDASGMERMVMASGLDWTIARPPSLTTGPFTGSYEVADDRMPRGRLSISRADVAHFLLDELAANAHVRRVVGMASVQAKRADGRERLETHGRRALG
jgi:putative NADH-flavin reductase